MRWSARSTISTRSFRRSIPSCCRAACRPRRRCIRRAPCAAAPSGRSCSLAGAETVGAPVLAYINRLSDYLFVAARFANRRGESDVLWVPGAQQPRSRAVDERLPVPPPPVPSLPVLGDSRRYPVARIFCVGRNYEDHAREMGHDGRSGEAVLLLQERDGVAPGRRDDRLPAGHRPTTISRSSSSSRSARPAFKITKEAALDAVYGYAVRARHDAARPATFRARQAAAVDARQGRRGERAGLRDRAGRAHRPPREGRDHLAAERASSSRTATSRRWSGRCRRSSRISPASIISGPAISSSPARRPASAR